MFSYTLTGIQHFLLIGQIEACGLVVKGLDYIK